MKHKRQFKKISARSHVIPKWVCVAAVLFTIDRSLKLLANPTGMTVVSGSGRAQQAGSQFNVTVSQTAILNWSSFNIKPGETTTFLQPSANSVVFNQIGDANPSQIFGNLNANGTVILANANGFYFGPNSMISVGGSFIATTSPLTPDFGAGSAWQFTGMPPLASIVNYGQIKVGTGKSLYLIATQLENHGELAAPGGDIGLYAGQSVLVSERPDGRGLSANMTVPSGAVNNFGQITADAGTIALQAQVVNQNGIIQADSVQNKNGVIELIASDALTLGADSQILARGDDSATGSAGGNVTLKSENIFRDASGSTIVTAGGLNGGNGGNVEVSAPNILSLESAMDAGAKAGFTGGSFLLDPANIVLGTTGAGTVPANGTVGYNSGGTLTLDVSKAFLNKNFSSILLQATANITLNASTTWDLTASTGISAGQLTLQAGGDIIFGNGSKITDANGWSVTLDAGYSFANNSVQSGVGNIYLNGGSGRTQNGTIQLGSGAVNLFAGQSILVGSGSIYTTGGGSIYANALAGDINCGTANGGYQFTTFGYSPVAVLGGISTAAGGDVTLIAGNNITSLPTVPAGQRPGASGAYRSGDVTIVAGNQVQGNFTLANGTGTILAGVTVQNGVVNILNSAANIGTAQRPVNLSLIKGSWNAWAGGNIAIGEVRNPNGTFNSNKRPVTGVFSGNTDGVAVPTQTAFAFDYAADAAVNFWAGNAIELVGGNLPRVNGQNQDMQPIYAPILSLNAGAGGIKIDNSIILYPSSEGALSIVTRDGGDLVGTALAAGLTGITMSDSGLPGWATFEQGHASTPLHLNDPNPVTLDISGSIESFSLTVPTFADIAIAGDTYNFGFVGRNLSPAQTTSINVAGDIMYRGNLTSVPLTDPLPAALFSASTDFSTTSKLQYDATTGKLTFVGVMSTLNLAYLLNPVVLAYDAKGYPIYDADGNQQTISVALTDGQKAAIQQLYADSQSATLGDQGLALAGPGAFNVNARNINLGISGGISVTAPDAALAAISPYGAVLNVGTLGNLSLTSTKIANESLLGGINLIVGGTLDVGSQFTTFGDPNAPKGIFTTSSGDISVFAQNDINLNGSRIAAYNGGNITIESLHGNVNAGAGGAGYVSLNALQLDPTTHQLVSIPATIPGSGILATTVVGSDALLGNILVETPNGNISASQGGVIQISFNGTDDSKATTMLLAGYELRDADGVGRLSAADISADNKVVDVANPAAPFDLVNPSGGKIGTFVNVSPDRNIDATGSGVIGQNVILKATGYIAGLFVGNYVDFNPGKSTPPDVGPPIIISTTTPKVSSPPSDGGTDPTVISDGSSNAAPPPAVATAEAPIADTAETADETKKGLVDEEDEQKNKKQITLARKVSRVTVLLPTKNN